MDEVKDKSLEPSKRGEAGELISFFKDNHSFVFCYKKSEKIVTALYLVTNLFSDSEPMKWSLRKKGGELLSAMLSYKDISSDTRLQFVHEVTTRILEILSLLEIVERAGSLSQMNFSILKREFLRLITEIESAGENQPGSNLIPEALFDSDFSHSRSPELARNLHHHIQPAKKRETAPAESHVLKRTERQEIILGILRKKGNLTIKDISASVTDCSEKTIQRELNSFIKNGVLKRSGERRWSRYSLA